MVLAHHFSLTSSVNAHRKPSLAAFRLFFYLSFLFGLCINANAQTTVNGQIFTDGLAIVNAPAQGSSFTVGSHFQLSIDVSGDGKLASDDRNTRFTSLEAYLISGSTFTNITVAQGSTLLPGSESVVSVDITIPSCASPGAYQLTIYEGSVINGTSFFSITPIPIRITNPRPFGKPCTTLFNAIQKLPQASSPPTTQPWLGSANPVPESSSTSAASTTSTSTATSETSSTSASETAISDSSTTASSTSSGGSSGTSQILTSSSTSEIATSTTSTRSGEATVTVSASASTITKVISSVETSVLTTTRPGTTEIQTTTFSTVSTTTMVVTSTKSKDGFFPVNNNSATGLSPSSMVATLMILLFVHVLMI